MNFVLAHEEFPVPQLVEYGAAAEQAGFEGIWTSDHFQPWQPNEGHSGQAWVTLAALTQRTTRLIMGTGVTTPTFKYRPAIVAAAWASLNLLAPGRFFLGLGTGENFNEAASGGGWGLYPERAARLVEAVRIIRRLWTGEHVTYNGQYWQVDARLYFARARRTIRATTSRPAISFSLRVLDSSRPLLGVQDARLAREHLAEQDTMYLVVPVGTAIGEHGEAIVQIRSVA